MRKGFMAAIGVGAIVLGANVALASTYVSGSAAIGTGISDAGATFESILMFVVAPILAVGVGLAAGVSTRAGGGSYGGSAASGILAGGVAGWIPIAASTQFTAAEPAVFGALPASTTTTAVTDPWTLMLAVGLLGATVIYRQLRKPTNACQQSN